MAVLGAAIEVDMDTEMGVDMVMDPMAALAEDAGEGAALGEVSEALSGVGAWDMDRTADLGAVSGDTVDPWVEACSV
jgi:hypothetical protein